MSEFCQTCPFLNIDRIIISVIKRYREEIGEISKLISRQELMKIANCSITQLHNAEERGKLTKIKRGNHNNTVYYERQEAENWMFKSNLI